MKKLIALMLVVVLCLVSCGGAEPEPAPQTSLVTRVAAIESELVKLSAKVAGAPDVSAIKSDLSALSSDVEELSRQIDALGEQIEALEEEKQEEEEGDVDPEDAVEVSEQYARTLEPPYDAGALAGGATYRLQTRVRITLENQLSVDLEDIELSAEVRVESETSGIEVVNVELVGAEFDWDSWGGDYFISWGDIKLDATDGDRYVSYLYVTVKNMTDTPITKYEVSVERIRVECEDYEVKK